MQDVQMMIKWMHQRFGSSAPSNDHILDVIEKASRIRHTLVCGVGEVVLSTSAHVIRLCFDQVCKHGMSVIPQ
jgi:hypothetical protein